MIVGQEDERAKGGRMYQYLYNQYRWRGLVIDRNSSWQAKRAYETVDRVLARLGPAASQLMRRDLYSWRYFIVHSRVRNAGSLPGNHLVIYGGFFKVAQTEEDWATVLGHEIAHIAARHSGERESHGKLAEAAYLAAALGLSAIYGGYPPPIAGHAMNGAQLLVQYGFLLPFSRTHEYEADLIGLMIMAKAGYDPEDAIRFWKRYVSESKRSDVDFFSTHPSNHARLEALKENLPKARPVYRDLSYDPRIAGK